MVLFLTPCPARWGMPFHILQVCLSSLFFMIWLYTVASVSVCSFLWQVWLFENLPDSLRIFHILGLLNTYFHRLLLEAFFYNADIVYCCVIFLCPLGHNSYLLLSLFHYKAITGNVSWPRWVLRLKGKWELSSPTSRSEECLSARCECKDETV